MATAERALAYLKQLRTPPAPRNFELLFNYVAGHNPELNAALRRAILAHAGLSEIDADRLLRAYVPQYRLDEKVEEVGDELSAELASIVADIQHAARSTGDLGKSLQALMAHLGQASSAEQIKLVVGALVVAARAMAENSLKLEARIAQSKHLIQDLHQDLEALRAESLTDELTGIPNRKRFGQLLKMETLEADESGDPLCLAIVDVDNFKRVNDRFGHQTGDQVLRLVAQTLRRHMRPGDHAARYGGEEFALLLPRTGLREAVRITEQIRKAVGSREIIKRSSRQCIGLLTLSIGVTPYRLGETPDCFIGRADRCLYDAKQRGRDRVECGLREALPMAGRAA